MWIRNENEKHTKFSAFLTSASIFSSTYMPVCCLIESLIHDARTRISLILIPQPTRKELLKQRAEKDKKKSSWWCLGEIQKREIVTI